MNDSEYLRAIFNAVCGLAERLTGERMIVSVHTEDGRILRTYGDRDGVAWVNSTSEAALIDPDRYGRTAESPPRSHEA
jgi:hypothetical protein